MPRLTSKVVFKHCRIDILQMDVKSIWHIEITIETQIQIRWTKLKNVHSFHLTIYPFAKAHGNELRNFFPLVIAGFTISNLKSMVASRYYSNQNSSSKGHAEFQPNNLPIARISLVRFEVITASGKSPSKPHSNFKSPQKP